MNTPVRWMMIAALSGCLSAVAQNFSGGDNFSSVVGGHWSADTTAGGGAFTVSSGALNFSDGGLASFGDTSSAYRNWEFSAGSYVADWQVQVDFTLGLASQVASQTTGWTLFVANNADITDNARLTFQQSYMMSATRNATGSFYTNDAASTSAQLGTAATTVTMRASYLASTHQITLDFNGGSGFTTLTSAVIDGAGLGWGMGASDTFGVRLQANNLTNAGATTAITSGMYADNFSASGAAVPEPSTYAVIAGLLALGAAGWRRRLGQQ